MRLRIGSLFSGYDGLDMGVQSVLGGDVAWHCENDSAASRVLAHHYPDVPNLGDITAVDWSQVEPVDVLTGGFPCQPVSCAGKRAGIADERWLFDEVVRALGNLDPRPRLCVFENVPGLLTAGGGDAMARVIHGLASVGYVGQWRVVRAADVGAPHGRARVFIVAWPNADPTAIGCGAAGWDDRLRPARLVTEFDANANNIGSHGHGLYRSSERWRPESQDGSLNAADSDESRRQGCQPAWRQYMPAWRTVTDTNSASSETRQRRSGAGDTRRLRPVVGGITDWGQYGLAVSRWERVLGRVAPQPTEPGTKGQPRLSPAFVEWLMGLPAGWVTDVPDVNRNNQLKVLGNGVVPQQAALALRMLLPMEAAA